MFGNPQISNTPVDDIYSTQADTYGNSFYNPVNPANMNPGWGIDPSLLTPSYTAQYRPGYSGSNGAVQYERSGFFSSLNQLAPYTNTPIWGNPVMHTQDSVDSVSSRPVDAAMWGAQRIGLPVAAFWGIGKAMGGYNGFGMARGAAAAGKTFGRGLGTGLARGMGLSTIGKGIVSRGMASTLGGVGSIAAGYGIPLLTMQALAEGAERAIFNPYINTRRSAEELRANFNGVTFGDSQGNFITGGGLGGRESSEISSQITSQGIQDMNLGTGEYAEAASMITRAGLMDNVNSKGISKRIKDSMEQVKLIMSVASMPEIRDAIEQLSKFQKMGANVSGGLFSDAAGTMRQMGSLASIAGTNVQKLMNTVGAQGQYLYQANGMTPYLGQLAAATSYSALSAGNRMGLISSAQLARMGGLDGATQASLTGQINASQTLYNKLSNYNTYMGKGQNDSMLGNLSQFGQTMAADPMGVYGGLILNGRQMAGRQLQEKGSLAAENQVWQMMKDQPGMVDRKTGKVTIERATPFLMQQGWTEDQIQAFAAQRISETDKDAYDLSIKAMNKTLKEQQMQYVEQNTLYAGIMGRTARGVMKAGRNLTDKISSSTIKPVAEFVGETHDNVNSLLYNMWYGDTIKSNNISVEDALEGNVSKDKPLLGFDVSKLPDFSKTSRRGGDRNNLFFNKGSSEGNVKPSETRESNTQIREVASRLNTLKDKGDADAIAYFKNPPSSKESVEALNKLISKKQFSKETLEYLRTSSNYQQLVSELNKAPRDKAPDRKPNNIFVRYYETMDLLFGGKPKTTDDLRSTLTKVGGLEKEDVGVNLRVAGLAYDAATKVVDGETLAPHNIEKRLKTDKSLQEISKITKIDDPQKLMAYIEKTSGAAIDNKLVRLSMGAINVDPNLKGDSLVKAASKKVGGGVYDESAIETKNLDQSEKLKSSTLVKEDANMRMDITDRLKSGHIDFSGYQSTMSALDNKASTKQFKDAVDQFEKIVKGEGSIAPKRSWMESIFNSRPNGEPNKLPGFSGQKDMKNSSGN